MDEMAAVQQAVQNLREDIAASEARMRDQINRHCDDDAREFAKVTKAIEESNKRLAEWSGAITLIKWTGGICLPLILAGVVAHVLRHWN